ncbi:MAG TPA: hypothetical protein VG097_02440 [Gemmata sp.]|jgi:hypothetical protein|nr:hypothetical protein [Gemmata sp.]
MAAPTARMIAGLLASIAVVGGCTERPKAPPLINEAVYQYELIGLRFLTPEGWSITSRSTLPPGPLTKPMMLVAYHEKQGEHPAAFELLAVDLPEDTDMGKYLLENRLGKGLWTIKSPAEKITVNEAEATRYLLSQQEGKTEHLREATVFRRAGRVYLFIASFAPTDLGSRDQVRRSIESVTWTK